MPPEALRHIMHEGPCAGGPLDGQPGQTRYPKGFLLVDKPACRCWIYEWTGTGFQVRDEQPDTYDPARAVTAAEGDTYDVRAAAGASDAS